MTGIAPGPDGRMWATEQYGNNVAAITTAGSFTEYASPTASSTPGGLATGSDGNLWVTENTGNKMAMMTGSRFITECAVPTPGSGPFSIAAGPDGNLWFVERGGNKVGKITIASGPPPGVAQTLGLGRGLQPRVLRSSAARRPAGSP